MKLTINDIAAMCGVSKGTVNRAIHDKPGISAATKKRIMEVIEKHQFQQSYFATSLATGVTNQIAMVVPGVMNELFSMLYTHVEHLCWEKGFYPSLSLSNNDATREAECLSTLLSRGVDGILLFPVSRDATHVRRVLDRHVPLVFVLNEIEGVQTNVVRIDDYSAMYASTQRLLEAGHRRILYLDGNRFTSAYNANINTLKYNGYRDALCDAGVEPDPTLYSAIAELRYGPSGMATFAEILRQTQTQPTAVLCFHDRIAMWACRMAQALGYAVPGDISIVGFDNINDLHWFTPMLTTTAVPIEAIARHSVEILERHIKHREQEIQRVTLDTAFVPGESIATL